MYICLCDSLCKALKLVQRYEKSSKCSIEILKMIILQPFINKFNLFLMNNVYLCTINLFKLHYE